MAKREGQLGVQAHMVLTAVAEPKSGHVRISLAGDTLASVTGNHL